MHQLLFLLILRARPLSTMFMMRGMHGGHGGTEQQRPTEPRVIDTTAEDVRLAELERECGTAGKCQ